ncbi:inner membrane protein YbjM, partial [Salmonella enterica subsp. enterica serovar Typhi]|nr:inner membrane protein YbjM [Salmonella enterica subsp. enterica serovar Typhi]
AWLFSAVFWCALGALCYLFISSLFSHRRKKTPIAPSGRGRRQSNQAWLFSAVFWCALGALCYLFISSLFSHRRKKTP